MLPYDDPRIGNDQTVLRFIDPEHHWVFDQNQGRWRVSSALFSESSTPNGGMSVQVEQLIVADGLTIESRLPHPRCGMARLVVRDLRNLHLTVGLDPLPDNPYQAEVWGIGNNKRIRRTLAEQAQIVREPRPQ